MSAFADRVLTMGKLPVGPGSSCAWVPLLGATWVVVNVALLGLGTQIAYPMSCSFAAGIINGTILSTVAVVKASERFRAGTTGMLGGLSLSGLRKDGSMIWKGTEQLHSLIDQLLAGLGFTSERWHHAIEQEVLYLIWTTVLVVMASLVAEWILSAKAER